jgi:hypothetical protein
MTPHAAAIQPDMLPAGPTRETPAQCPHGCPTPPEAIQIGPLFLVGWLRFPRLSRPKGLATGIIGLW